MVRKHNHSGGISWTYGSNTLKMNEQRMLMTLQGYSYKNDLQVYCHNNQLTMYQLIWYWPCDTACLIHYLFCCQITEMMMNTNMWYSRWNSVLKIYLSQRHRQKLFYLQCNPALCRWVRSVPCTASIENSGYCFFFVWPHAVMNKLWFERVGAPFTNMVV